MKTFVFPGQGSQKTGMLKELFESSETCRDLFEQASEICSVSFEELFFNPDKSSELNLTENTQPALVLASTALFAELSENQKQNISYVCGHSLGEYSALVASGAMSFKDAILSVKKRGAAMQQAVPAGEGAMLAVMGMESEQVDKMCRWVEDETGEVLSAANFNSPGQVVVSGSKKAADWLKENFNKEDFGNPTRHKFIPLKVSAPFHCSLMMPAQLVMAEVLANVEISKPKWPVVQNFTAMAHLDPVEIKENLIKQVTGPVRWTETLKFLAGKKVSEVIEVGPSKVLTGLVKKIDSESFKTFNIEDNSDLQGLGE